MAHFYCYQLMLALTWKFNSEYSWSLHHASLDKIFYMTDNFPTSVPTRAQRSKIFRPSIRNYTVSLLMHCLGDWSDNDAEEEDTDPTFFIWETSKKSGSQDPETPFLGTDAAPHRPEFQFFMAPFPNFNALIIPISALWFPQSWRAAQSYLFTFTVT